jgi:hypothetical protein
MSTRTKQSTRSARARRKAERMSNPEAERNVLRVLEGLEQGTDDNGEAS